MSGLCGVALNFLGFLINLCLAVCLARFILKTMLSEEDTDKLLLHSAALLLLYMIYQVGNAFEMYYVDFGVQITFIRTLHRILFTIPSLLFFVGWYMYNKQTFPTE